MLGPQHLMEDSEYMELQEIVILLMILEICIHIDQIAPMKNVLECCFLPHGTIIPDLLSL